jgi:hypothetical protein
MAGMERELYQSVLRKRRSVSGIRGVVWRNSNFDFHFWKLLLVNCHQHTSHGKIISWTGFQHAEFERGGD